MLDAIETPTRSPTTTPAHRPGWLYVHCPACNRPPHENRRNARCRRCDGFGYLIVEDRRFRKAPNNG